MIKVLENRSDMDLKNRLKEKLYQRLGGYYNLAQDFNMCHSDKLLVLTRQTRNNHHCTRTKCVTLGIRIK